VDQTPEAAASRPQKIRYIDCIKGRAPVPADPVGFFLFHILMVGGMVTFMATFNGIRHDGIAFLEYMHWFYPLVFLFAFVWRRTAANAVTGRLIPRVIAPRFSGSRGRRGQVLRQRDLHGALRLPVGVAAARRRGLFGLLPVDRLHFLALRHSGELLRRRPRGED
jgi:hypothetical protein